MFFSNIYPIHLETKTTNLHLDNSKSHSNLTPIQQVRLDRKFNTFEKCGFYIMEIFKCPYNIFRLKKTTELQILK